jgi:hypothetical protein
MKKFINFIFTAIIAYGLSFFMGWPAIMVASITVAFLVPLKGFSVFLMPFLALFLSWAIQSYLLSSANNFILAERIAVLLPLGGNPYALVLATGLIGGLVAGISAIFGKQLYLLTKAKQ